MRHERLDIPCGEEFKGLRGVICVHPACEVNSLHARSKQPLFIVGLFRQVLAIIN